MALYTPGPWKFSKKNRRITNIHGVTISRALMMKGKEQAGFRSEEEALANATLIAAAPEILYVLKNALADYLAKSELDVFEIKRAIENAETVQS